MSLKKLVTGITILGVFIGLLVNFGDARTELVKLWPTIVAVLPVLALGGALGGVTLVGGQVWRWYVDRRPLPRGERFRQLAPDIEQILRCDNEQSDSTSFPMKSIRLYTRTIIHLNALGVRLPKEEADSLKLLILAEAGKLEKARKLFPLRAQKDKRGESD